MYFGLTNFDKAHSCAYISLCKNSVPLSTCLLNTWVFIMAPLLEGEFQVQKEHHKMFAMLCCCTLNSMIRWVVLKTRQFVSKLTVKRFLLKMLI